MTLSMVLSGLDGLVRLRVDEGLDADADARLWERLLRAWSRCVVDVDPGLVPETVAVPRQAWESRKHPIDHEAVLQSVTQQVTQAFIRQQAGKLFMVHAGGVSHLESGRSLVCVAPGGTGKTTLTAALGKRHGYLSDETIGVRLDGSIAPYPKPLSLRTAAPHKAETSPDDLGLLTAPPVPHLGTVVVLDRRDHVSGVEVERLGTLEAIEAITEQTSSLGHLPRGLHVVASLLESTGGAERWRYSEHADLLDLADDRLGAGGAR